MNFVSLDFETMTPELTSACAVGLVKVVDNVIVQRFYSLIKPIPDERAERNTFVHGITDEMVENAPTWGELFPQVENFFESGKIVCHNAATDVRVLDCINAHYGISLDTSDVTDTYVLTENSLVDACKEHDIDFGLHHDALCDATACAELLLSIRGVFKPVSVSLKPKYKKSFDKKALDSEVKKPLDADEVENKDTPFFQKKVVLTGTLRTYPERAVVAAMLKEYGADINTSISKLTDIVIVGYGAGPAKMKKIEKLNDQGCDIWVMSENDFLDIMKQYGMR